MIEFFDQLSFAVSTALMFLGLAVMAFAAFVFVEHWR